MIYCDLSCCMCVLLMSPCHLEHSHLNVHEDRNWIPYLQTAVLLWNTCISLNFNLAAISVTKQYEGISHILYQSSHYSTSLDVNNKYFLFVLRLVARRDVYMMFKALNTKKNGKLSLEEFYRIYDYTDCDWKVACVPDN